MMRYLLWCGAGRVAREFRLLRSVSFVVMRCYFACYTTTATPTTYTPTPNTGSFAKLSDLFR